MGKTRGMADRPKLKLHGTRKILVDKQYKKPFSLCAEAKQPNHAIRKCARLQLIRWVDKWDRWKRSWGKGYNSSRRLQQETCKRKGMGAVRKLIQFRIIKQYKKSHLGNERKKPFANSSHSKRIVLEKADEPLEKIRIASWDAAVRDIEDLESFAKNQGAAEADSLALRDITFWSERLGESKYDINEEELRPSFSLPNVMGALFRLAKTLCGIDVVPADALAPVWNSDVRFFCVKDSSGNPIAYFYFDPYSRPSEKRDGAWMDEVFFHSSRVMIQKGSSVSLPVAHMVCNQTPPVGDKPSLMTFREVETVFHEFGHALQHMLTIEDEGLVALLSSVSHSSLLSNTDMHIAKDGHGPLKWVMVIGTFLLSPQEVTNYSWSCMFGEVEVPAEILVDGVLCCHAPPHTAGLVPFNVTCSNRGSSSGSAVSFGAELVDFALGTDTTGGVRIPASFCGILGFRPSQGTVSSVGVLPNSQSLETVGWLAREPSVLCQFGHALLNLSAVTHKRQRSFIFLFELSDIPNQKSVHIVRKAIENLSGYQTPKHIDVGQHIASNVPSLAEFCEQSGTSQNSASTLKALSSVMLSIQRHEFKTNHEEWSNTCKSFFGPRFSNDVVAALKSRNESIKSLYRVKTEMPATIQSLLKEDGILVIPTVADPLPKLNTKNKDKFLDRNCALSSIASMSGCCQVSEKQYKKSHLGNEWNKPFVGAKKRKRSVTDDSEADEEVEEDNEGDDEAKEDNEGDDEAKEDNEGDEAAEVDDSEPESLLRPKFLYVKGMSYLTKVEDIKNFFKDKGIRVKFVKLLPSERNRGVKTRSAVVKLGSLREIKKAMKFNGHEMQVANQPHPVFMERYRNELITIFVIGFRDFLDDNADEVAVREALMKTFEKYDVRGIFLPENQRFGYLLLDCKKKDSRKAQNSARKSFEAFKKLLRDQSGQNDDGMVPLFSTMSAREANMKPEFLRELGLN